MASSKMAGLIVTQSRLPLASLHRPSRDRWISEINFLNFHAPVWSDPGRRPAGRDFVPTFGGARRSTARPGKAPEPECGRSAPAPPSRFSPARFLPALSDAASRQPAYTDVG